MLLRGAHQDDLSTIAEDVRWLTIQRILYSDGFRKSTRLPRLLRYLAIESLLNRSKQLTERAVAIRVFDRGEEFDPSIDTVVRSQMVRLRQKLDQYAEEQGKKDPFHIVIPKGDYVVRFEPNDGLKPPPEAEHAAPDEPPILTSDSSPVATSELVVSEEERMEPQTEIRWPAPWIMISLLAGGLLCALLLGHILLKSGSAAPAEELGHPLWSALFQENRPTLWVSGDSGLVMLENLGGKEITLEEYLNHDFSRITRGLSPEKLEIARSLGKRHYTSVTDVTLVDSLSRIATENHSTLTVKWARDLNLSDLKRGNVILGGAHLASPWLELFEPNMDFVGVSDLHNGSFHFVNKHPRGDERSSYSVAWKDGSPRVLGLVTFMPGLDKKGNLLVIEGSSVTGGEAVLDFLLDDRALMPFLDSIKEPNGALPYFEVILESTSVDGNAGPFHVVAFHTHPR